MTEIRKTLLKLVEEYRQSLDRVQGEKELMKCIEARAVTECGIAIKPFKVVATARLAANMAGWEGMVKPEAERLKWAALADMMEQGAAAIRHFVGDAKLALTVIAGGAA